VTPTVDQHMAWYRRMLEIRLFEEKVQELFMEGLILLGGASLLWNSWR